MKPAVREDGTEYYEYLITYVDDVISVSEDPRSVLQQLAKRFKLKKDKIAAPTDFLGAQVQKRNRPGADYWSISSAKYLGEAIKKVELQCSKVNTSILEASHLSHLDTGQRLKVQQS